MERGNYPAQDHRSEQRSELYAPPFDGQGMSNEISTGAARVRELEAELAAAKAEAAGGIGYLARPIAASGVEYLRPSNYPQ